MSFIGPTHEFHVNSCEIGDKAGGVCCTSLLTGKRADEEYLPRSSQSTNGEEDFCHLSDIKQAMGEKGGVGEGWNSVLGCGANRHFRKEILKETPLVHRVVFTSAAHHCQHCRSARI